MMHISLVVNNLVPIFLGKN